MASDTVSDLKAGFAEYDTAVWAKLQALQVAHAEENTKEVEAHVKAINDLRAKMKTKVDALPSDSAGGGSPAITAGTPMHNTSMDGIDPSTSPLALQAGTAIPAANSADSTNQPVKPEPTVTIKGAHAAPPGPVPVDPAIPDGAKVQIGGPPPPPTPAADSKPQQQPQQPAPAKK